MVCRHAATPQFGLGSTVEPAEPAACPLASQVGTVKVVTPLLEKPLEGQVFLGEPECSPCSNADAEDGHIFRLFLQARSRRTWRDRQARRSRLGEPDDGTVAGDVYRTAAASVQRTAVDVQRRREGAAWPTPRRCGTFTTTTDLTPWSTSGLGGLSGTEPIAGTPDATPSSSFDVDWNGAGGACPGSLPFSPSFAAGSQTPRRARRARSR